MPSAGGFAKLGEANNSFVVSVCPHGKNRLPRDGCYFLY